MNDASLEVARRTFAIEADCLAKAFAYIDPEEFSRSVRVLATAPRIAASGCGHSGIACMHFVHLMCCIERPARFLSPSEALHGGMGFLQRGDVMILASRGGKTAELMPILDICRKLGAIPIAVTENHDSPLAKGSDIVLKMSVTQETDRDGIQGTTSNTLMNAIFDALQAALIEETGFKSEQFAIVHPGGAVGELLNHGQSLR